MTSNHRHRPDKVLAVVVLLITLVPCRCVFTDCGGTLRGDNRGVISTPNFPNAYPVPIRCRWVIEAPEDKIITIYFTQFYMREGLQAAEYAYYSDSLYMGRTDFGTISSDREPTTLMTNKPVLVLDLVVFDISNIHMRVREHFLDVFGFNVTYEISSRNSTVHNDSCIEHHCTFTGNCYTSRNFEKYFCSCFNGFFGEECQYDAHCGPGGASQMCLNGGTCRYYIGSTVQTCECPIGYDGARCEQSEQHSVPSNECAFLGCSQLCTVNSKGVPVCSCHPGLALADDKKSCVHTGRTRFLMSFRVLNVNTGGTNFGENTTEILKKGIQNALQPLFKSRLRHIENLTVLSVLPDDVVQFHLFGQMDDRDKARQVMESALNKGKIGNYSVDKHYIRFEWEPRLNIQGLETSESMPVVEGSELSLACIVQGSSDLQVKWLKDGAPINIQTTYRGVWSSLVPKNSKKQYTALLSFDSTSVIDTGVFTCEVSDWGLEENKSIDVFVVSVPKPRVTPMTATLHEDESLIITCLSQEDIHGKFGYNWLKNGKILNSMAEPEMVEDLFPAGSRILIVSAKESAVYTCIISSSAGDIRKDSVITVIHKERKILLCQSEDYMGVRWSDAAANSEDIQHCPFGYSGDVKRLCLMRKKDMAAWEEPDFSGCVSKEIKLISRKFESLKMGYMFTSVQEVLEELKAYLSRRPENFNVSEGVPIVDLLDSIQEYEHRNLKDNDNFKNNSQAFLDVISFLLTFPHLIQKQSHLIKLHHLLLNFGLVHGSILDTEKFETFERTTLVLEVGKVQRDDQKLLHFPRQKRDVMNQNISWLTDSLEVDIGTWFTGDFHKGNNSLSIAVVFYKNLSLFMPKLFLSQKGGLDLEYHLHSRLMAVAVKGKHPLSFIQKSGFKVKATLQQLNHSVPEGLMWNISCGIADFSQGKKVEFMFEGCERVSQGNFTLCQCTQLGTYAILLTTFLQTGNHSTAAGFEIIAGLGCAICAFLICLTLFILLIFWRQIHGAITVLKIQVCVALLGAYGTMLKALHESLTPDYYPYVVSTIQFFMLAAFCMQLCLSLTVYIEFVDTKNVRYPELKIAAMGWAFPLIVVGATLAAQVLEGFHLKSWWLKFETNYFYAYVVSVFIVSALQVLLFLTVKAELHRHEKMEAHKKRRIRNRASLLHRSLVILVILLLVSISSILFTNYDEDVFRYIFAFTSSLLGLVIFLSYTLLSENIHKMCFTCSPEEAEIESLDERIRSRSNSFKSFLKPEIIGDGPYCSGMCHENESLEQKEERIKRISAQINATSNHKSDWKDIDHLVLMQNRIGKIVSPANGSSKRKKCNYSPAIQRTPDTESWNYTRAPPLELQELEGSPRSSHLYLVESPYDVSPSGTCGGKCFAPHHSSVCALHRTVGHSDASESESSQSSSTTEDSGSQLGVRTGGFVPYKPSSLLQFEGATISEEDESELGTDADSSQRTRLSNPSVRKVRIYADKHRDVEGQALSLLPRREAGNCSSEYDSSDADATSSQEQSEHAKKSWSITTV